MMRFSKVIIIICSLACFVTGFCSQPPQQLPWPTASYEDAGLNRHLISELNQQLEEKHFKRIHSLIIVKDSKLVYENYFGIWSRENLHPVFSVTKSISSALIGIAIDKNMILNVNEKLKNLLPISRVKQPGINWDDSRGDIRLKHLLTMTSGFKWIELSIPYGNPNNSHNRMARTKNWLGFVLSRPMVNSPGTVYNYNTGTSNLFAAMIKHASGLAIDKFAEKYLFKPLGINRYSWYSDPQGNPCSGGSNGGLGLRPLDMAKVGYLFLKKGYWQGKSIISSSWIEESVKPQIGSGFYGYQWWLGREYVNSDLISFYYADGYGGQKIYLFPAIDMVVVITAGNYGDNAYLGQTQSNIIIRKYILPAAEKK